MKASQWPLSGAHRACGCKAHEVEPGRSVPSHWDGHLVETWAERKARRVAERAQEARP